MKILAFIFLLGVFSVEGTFLLLFFFLGKLELRLFR